jgi:hypothetical protein
VSRATAPFSVEGVEYAAGSYVVDMHQPLRGMANVLLADGTDISDRVPDMYDISAWSLSLLWGADVLDVGSTTDASLPAPVEPITEAGLIGQVPEGAKYLELATAGAAEYQAVNGLLDAGVPVSAFEDGSVIIRGDQREAALTVASKYDVSFTASDGLRLRTEPSRGLDRLTVAYSGNQDDRVTLQRLGFSDIRLVTAATITSGEADLATADVLWVGGNLAFTGANAGGAATVQAFLDAGKGVAGKGTAIATFASTFGLTTVTARSGTSGSNGIVHVTNAEGGLLSTYAQDTAFVYPAVWYLDLGENAKVEQTYATEGTFVSGHWADSADPRFFSIADAAGQASVVTATGATGSRLAMLGTSVNFRTHPVGSYPDIARSLHWVSGEGAAVVAPVIEEDLVEGNRGEVTVPDEAEAGETIRVGVGEGLEGQVFETVLFSAPVSLGTATVANAGYEVTIPADTAAGAHRVAVISLDGVLLGWDDLTVTVAVTEPPVEPGPGAGGGQGSDPAGSGSGSAPAGASGDLADTGFSPVLPLGIAAGVLLLGAAAILIARNRRRSAGRADRVRSGDSAD